MLDHRLNVSGDDGVQICARIGGDGDADAEVLHPSQIRFRDIRSLKYTVELCGVVKGMACVEERERFGVDRLARSEDRVVKNLVRDCPVLGWNLVETTQDCPGLGWKLVETTQRALFTTCERQLVDGEADFWRQSEKAD